MSAMNSLIEKYSKMDSQVEAVHQEISQTTLKIQNSKTHIDELGQERQEMKQMKIRTLAQQIQLEKSAQKAMQHREEALVLADFAKQKKLQVEANLEYLEKSARDYRLDFLQRSRNFRSACKRFPIERDALGLSHDMPLKAYVLVKQSSKNPELALSLEVDTSEHAAKEIDKNETYLDAVKEIQSLEESQEKSKRKYDDLVDQKGAMENRKAKRQNQHANLQNQLTRLKNDVQKLQDQIQQSRRKQHTSASASRTHPTAQNQHQTHQASFRPHHAVERANPYAHDKHPASVSTDNNRPAPVPIRNPYSKAPRAGVTPKSIARRSHSLSTKKSSQKQSNPERQFPHRVGRVRASRDFGLSLRIDDDSSGDDDDDDGLLNYVAFRK